MQHYREFIENKSQLDGGIGFDPTFHHPREYDFQSHLVEWACRQGRTAMFADCGLGKTLMQLSWAHNVNRHTNKPVLILAPLNVSRQTVDEAEKFGFEAKRSIDGRFVSSNGIVTTNYERLGNFDPNAFAGVVCDESSIIKNFEGSRKSEITEFMRKVEYRLLCTATPSPNDYIELGTSSEALGYLGFMDMLGMFFKNDENSLHPAFRGSKWRFKHHAERNFWRWMCSWSRAVRRPSDLGFEDRDFILPPLYSVDHIIESAARDGDLFAMPAIGLDEERAERRVTIRERCEKSASILSGADSGVAWCHLNAEADLLVEMIPGSAQISGSDKDERKEELFDAFRSGQLKRLVTKPKIAAFGSNWQHSHTMTYFIDNSFEQYYQAVRRMLRFGQKMPVTVHNISTQSLRDVTQNLRRKSDACEIMFETMVTQMNDALQLRRFSEHSGIQELPSWL